LPQLHFQLKNALSVSSSAPELLGELLKTPDFPSPILVSVSETRTSAISLPHLLHFGKLCMFTESSNAIIPPLFSAEKSREPDYNFGSFGRKSIAILQ